MSANRLPLFEPYNIATTLIAYGILLPWKNLMVLMNRCERQELTERLGLQAPPRRRGPTRVVLHAVSVGEMSAAEPLIRSLPETDFVLTTGNIRGKQMGNRLAERFPNISSVWYLPAEPRRILKRWFRSVDPELLVIMETDLWPNLIVTAADLGVPVLIVNGRLYPDDPKKYRLAKWFFAAMFSRVAWIGVQSVEDKERFVSIGADPLQIEVVGNLKYGIPLNGDAGRKVEQSADPLIIAGSTHHPEERLIIESFKSVRSRQHRVRLVLAPRHVERVEEVEQIAKSAGFATARWSVTRSLTGNDSDVLIIDEIGLLSSLYRDAAIVIIGGSFIAHGGHNPIEAARFGVPVVIGPHAENFRQIVNDFLTGGGIRQIRAAELTAVLLELLSDPDLCASAGAKALAVVRARQGVTQGYVAVMKQQLTKRGRPLSIPGERALRQTEPIL